MKKQTHDILAKTIIVVLAILFVVICSLTMVSAYYPGETIVIENEMGIGNLVYTIIGNSNYVGELDMKINKTNISITFPQDMIPDSFDIVFLENITNTVTQTIYVSSGGGGGTRTKYVDRNVTVYRDKIIEKIVEKEIKVPGETIKEEINKGNGKLIIIIIMLVLVSIALLLWNYYRGGQDMPEETYTTYDNIEKEVE